jgi:iduronate 2-sulfatase
MSHAEIDKSSFSRTRRQFLSSTAKAGLASALARSSLANAAPVKKRPPNVLFFMSDDMRVELGCYNSRFRAQTPNLDDLARRGVRFDRNYCQYPLCNPSRSSLLTGIRPTTSRILENRDPYRDEHIDWANYDPAFLATLPRLFFWEEHPDWISLPNLFRQNGYVAAGAGKVFHFDDPKAYDARNFRPEGPAKNAAAIKPLLFPPQQVPPRPSDVLPPLALDADRASHSDRIFVLEGNGEGHPENQVAERTIENLRKYKDQPFFIGCGFSKPHSPPTAPQRFFDLYDPDKIELTPDFASWPTVPPGFPKAAIRMRNSDLFINRGASEWEAKQVIRAYLASLSWADWNIGRVVHELDVLGLRDNTIIVFVADHGYELGEKGKWSKHGSLFEMGTRVPLIIVAPDAAGNGHASFRHVESLDIYPTLVELCGLKLPPQQIEGNSLVPLLNQPDHAWDKAAFSVYSEDGKALHGIAVRHEKWRYVEFGVGAKNGALLFDEEADPLETKNLADDPQYAQQRARLSELLRPYNT